MSGHSHAQQAAAWAQRKIVQKYYHHDGLRNGISPTSRSVVDLNTKKPKTVKFRVTIILVVWYDVFKAV